MKLGDNLIMKKKISILTIFLSLSLALTIILFSRNESELDYKSLNKTLSIEFSTNAIVEGCKEKMYLDIKTSCLDGLIENYKKNEPNMLLPLITYFAKDSKLSVKCHELTHRAGAIISDSVSIKDILLLDFNYCNYGLQHGVLDVLAKVNKLDSNYIQILCGSLPTGEHLKNNCNHTLGHIIVEYLDPNPKSAVKLCANDTTGACINGVLMSYLQGYGNTVESENLFKNKTNIYSLLMELCSNVPAGQMGKCTILFPAFAYKFFPNDPMMIENLCNLLSEKGRRSCYRGIASAVAIGNIGNTAGIEGEIINKCRELDNYKDQCFIGYAIFLLVNTYTAPDLEVCDDLYDLELEYCRVGLKIVIGEKVDKRYEIN